MEGNLGSANTRLFCICLFGGVAFCHNCCANQAKLPLGSRTCPWGAGQSRHRAAQGTALAFFLWFLYWGKAAGWLSRFKDKAVPKITRLTISFLSPFSIFFTELNVRESDVRVCDESSCKYGGVCKEEGDGLKCACQFQVRAAHLFVCCFSPTFQVYWSICRIAA